MSSHREAPEISKDPVADNTDVYAFVSPDKPGHRHDHRQLHPVPEPAGRPELLRVRRRRALRDPREQLAASRQRRRLPVPLPRPRSATRRRSSTTPARSPRSPTRPGTGRSTTRSPGWTRGTNPGGAGPQPGRPAGQRRHPQHARTTRRPSPQAAIHKLQGDRLVFAGQRAEGFNVDLGSIFDLGALRPFQMAHLIPSAAAVGVNGTQGLERAHASRSRSRSPT